jgi:Phycobilisome degradation protein nblA
MNIPKLELNLEQEFALIQYENQVAGISQAQAQELLLESFRLLMIKDNVIRGLMKSEMSQT